MNSGAMVSPSSNLSEVSSQSTRPSLRAMKPSRLATMWMVTREFVFAIVVPPLWVREYHSTIAWSSLQGLGPAYSTRVGPRELGHSTVELVNLRIALVVDGEAPALYILIVGIKRSL